MDPVLIRVLNYFYTNIDNLDSTFLNVLFNTFKIHVWNVNYIKVHNLNLDLNIRSHFRLFFSFVEVFFNYFLIIVTLME